MIYCLFIVFCTPISTLADLSPYYEVSATLVTQYLEDVVGIYSKTDQSTVVHTWTSPIYKRASSQMYLLQESSSGDWIVAQDDIGQNVRLRQDRANYARTPDTDISVWRRKTGMIGMSILDLKVTSKPCDRENCENLLDETTTHRSVNARSNPSKNDDKGLPNGNGNTAIISIGCTVGGLFLIINLVVVVVCMRKRSRENLANQETIDENPEYGEGDEYYDEITKVVDQNDYYYSDI
eukprot:GFUD01079453.1.p1 GENE.GFUD01079453.1~~GFUD01079453.1.p1  ORF type:complete len:237 (+),score=54.56 GFUD01079453.1:49-759(+)